MAAHSSILAWRIPWTECRARLKPHGTHWGGSGKSHSKTSMEPFTEEWNQVLEMYHCANPPHLHSPFSGLPNEIAHGPLWFGGELFLTEKLNTLGCRGLIETNHPVFPVGNPMLQCMPGMPRTLRSDQYCLFTESYWPLHGNRSNSKSLFKISKVSDLELSLLYSFLIHLYFNCYSFGKNCSGD